MVKKQIKQSDLQKIADEIDNIGKENEAGHRKVKTSVKSANDINKKLKRLQKVVLLELEKVYPEGLTGSEIANRTGYSILSIRPRTTELKLQGLIIDTKKTRKNEGGKSEIIYQLRSLYVIEDYDLHKDKTDKK